MNTYKTRLFFAVILLTAVACSFVTGGPGISPDQPATQESVAPLPDTSTGIPPAPTEAPAISGPQPIGLAAQLADGLAIYSLDGALEKSTPLPNAGSITANTVVIISGYADAVPPIIYFSYENGGSLLVKAPASIYPLVNVDNLNGLVGAPGTELFAYARVIVTTGAENLPSELYVGSLAAPPSVPVTVLQTTEPLLMKVLALDVEGDTPVGVWYTLEPWGIGGDIVFAPRVGLYYFNLSNGATTEWLGQDFTPSALSGDQAWVAYTKPSPINSPDSHISVRNLQSGQTVSIPLAPANSDLRGAGDAVFSPDGRYVAWREASGWQMAETPDFHSSIRAADMDGNLVLDIQDSAFSGLHSEWTSVHPVAWLDEQTLLVQLGWGDTALLARLSLADPTPTIFVSGAFIGFTYP